MFGLWVRRSTVAVPSADKIVNYQQLALWFERHGRHLHEEVALGDVREDQLVAGDPEREHLRRKGDAGVVLDRQGPLEIRTPVLRSTPVNRGEVN